jgi:hypothetical protein
MGTVACGCEQQSLDAVQLGVDSLKLSRCDNMARKRNTAQVEICTYLETVIVIKIDILKIMTIITIIINTKNNNNKHK